MIMEQPYSYCVVLIIYSHKLKLYIMYCMKTVLNNGCQQIPAGSCIIDTTTHLYVNKK